MTISRLRKKMRIVLSIVSSKLFLKNLNKLLVANDNYLVAFCSRSLDVIASLYEKREIKSIYWSLRRQRKRRMIISRRSNQVKNSNWHQSFSSLFLNLCLRLLVNLNVESLKSRSRTISRWACRDVLLKRLRLRRLFNSRRN
jgi:hypothetical protein